MKLSAVAKNYKKKNHLKNLLTANQKKIQQEFYLNPTLKASTLWNNTKDQLRAFLGPTVYNQWFNKMNPIVVIDHTLILQAPNHLTCQWVNHQYLELINTLLSAQDNKITCAIVLRKNRPGLDYLKYSKAPLLK